MRKGNRAALNKLREQKREEDKTWLMAHYEPQPPRDALEVARENADIERRREAFGIY